MSRFARTFEGGAVAMIALLLFASGCAPTADRDETADTTDFEFVSAGRKLSGILRQPADGNARALVLFVHGTGMTDVRRENRYARLRKEFAELGIASLVWDKPGQGRSEGTFDDNQPLESAAQELLDAADALRTRRIPGSQRLGIWSASRGGWVAPLAMSQQPQFRFWISVGGPPAEDNKHYLIERNLPLEGRSPEQTARLMEEWRAGRRIFFAGGDYDTYLSATKTLRSDPIVLYLAGDLTASRETYAAEQRAFQLVRDTVEIDESSTSVINLRGMDGMLRNLDIDVLALFGELDTNVDWRRTRALYEATIGKNPRASLQIRTFPGCNHIIYPSATGTVREVQAAPPGGGDECDGYYETQIEWLRKHLTAL